MNGVNYGVKREIKTSRHNNTFIFVLIRTRLNKEVTYNIIIIISITLGLGSLFNDTYLIYDNDNFPMLDMWKLNDIST